MYWTNLGFPESALYHIACFQKLHHAILWVSKTLRPISLFLLKNGSEKWENDLGNWKGSCPTSLFVCWTGNSTFCEYIFNILWVKSLFWLWSCFRRTSQISRAHMHSEYFFRLRGGAYLHSNETENRVDLSEFRLTIYEKAPAPLPHWSAHQKCLWK